MTCAQVCYCSNLEYKIAMLLLRQILWWKYLTGHDLSAFFSFWFFVIDVVLLISKNVIFESEAMESGVVASFPWAVFILSNPAMSPTQRSIHDASGVQYSASLWSTLPSSTHTCKITDTCKCTQIHVCVKRSVSCLHYIKFLLPLTNSSSSIPGVNF